MNNKNKSLKNFIFTAINQITTIGVGLLLPRLYLVCFGSEINGLLTSLQQVLVYLALFEAGVGATALQALYGPIAKQNWPEINGVVSATNHYYKKTSLYYLLSLLGIAFIYPLCIESSLNYITLVGVVFFSGASNVILFACQEKYKVFLQADGKQYIVTNLITIFSVSSNIVKAVLIFIGVDLVLTLALAAIVNTLQIIYILIYIKQKYKSIDLTVAPNNVAISQKNYSLIHQISFLIFQNTPVLILTIFCGLEVVSVYALFKLVLSHLDSFLTVISNSVNFILGYAFQTDRKKFCFYIDVYESLYGAISFAAFSVAYYLLLPFMKIYTSGITDTNYIDPILPILFIAISILSAMRAPMLLTINIAGHFKQTTPQTIIEAVINLLVSLLGVYLFGIYGVLMGTIVALLYRTNDILIYANKKILKRSPLRSYSSHLLNIGVFLIFQTILSIMNIDINGIFQFLIAGTILIVVSIVVFIGTQFLIFKDVRGFICSLFQKIYKKINNY